MTMSERGGAVDRLIKLWSEDYTWLDTDPVFWRRDPPQDALRKYIILFIDKQVLNKDSILALFWRYTNLVS